jgi:hypothetical protein
MAADMRRAVWWQSLEIHLRAALIHEKSAGLLRGSGDAVGAMRATGFAAAEREAYAALLARHPEWDPWPSAIDPVG